MDSEDVILRTLRVQAWERAKGELMSVLGTYWGGNAKHEPMLELVRDFINKVESNGLQE